MEELSRRQVGAFCFLLFLLILLAYGNTLNSPLSYDDNLYVKIKAVDNSDTYFQLYPLKQRHLFYLSLAANHSIGGLEPFGYHVVNISVHFLTTLVIFFITYITLQRGTEWGRHAAPIAAITTLLFALSPVHSETVTYISGRATGLSGFFYFSALLMFILGSFSERKVGSQILFYIFSLICFLAAVLSKEPGFTLPAMILLYDFCFMQNNKWTSIKSRFLLYYLWILICGLLIGFNIMQEVILSWLDKMDSSYFLKQTTIVVHGFKLLLFPVGLTFDYDFPDAFFPHPVLRMWPILIIALLIFSASRYSSKAAKIFAFSVLWFLITLAPTNSFYPRLDLLSERNLYIPSFGVFFLIASLGYSLFLGSTPSKIAIGCLGIAFAFYATLLIDRNEVYKSNIGLWEDTVKNSPGKTRAWQNISHHYLKNSNYKKAFESLQRLIQSDPNPKFLSQAQSKLGIIHTQQRNFSGAIAAYNEAIRLDPPFPSHHFNLGGVYLKLGNFEKAKEAYEKAEQLYENHSNWKKVPTNLYLYKTLSLYRLKLYDQAETAARLFLSRSPGSKAGHALLGNIYREMGKTVEASREFARAQKTTNRKKK